MRMREESPSMKMLNTKMEGKHPRGRSRTRSIDQIEKDAEIRRETWEEIQKTRSGRIEMT